MQTRLYLPFGLLDPAGQFLLSLLICLDLKFCLTETLLCALHFLGVDGNDSLETAIFFDQMVDLGHSSSKIGIELIPNIF